AARGLGGSVGVSQLGARLVNGDLVVARIDLDKRRIRLGLLVVLYKHAHDSAPDARRNLCHMRIHLRIVGRFLTGRPPEPHANRDDDQDDNADERLISSLSSPSTFLIGHQRAPPRNCRTACSALPRSRASTAFPTLFK